MLDDTVHVWSLSRSMVVAQLVTRVNALLLSVCVRVCPCVCVWALAWQWTDLLHSSLKANFC